MSDWRWQEVSDKFLVTPEGRCPMCNYNVFKITFSLGNTTLTTSPDDVQVVCHGTPVEVVDAECQQCYEDLPLRVFPPFYFVVVIGDEITIHKPSCDDILQALDAFSDALYKEKISLDRYDLIDLLKYGSLERPNVWIWFVNEPVKVL